MGFFSKVRKRIKKFIPKEVRPFVPYLAAMIPGLQAMGPLSGIGSLAARKALIAGGTKFLTDDEADLKLQGSLFDRGHHVCHVRTPLVEKIEQVGEPFF